MRSRTAAHRIRSGARAPVHRSPLHGPRAPAHRARAPVHRAPLHGTRAPGDPVHEHPCTVHPCTAPEHPSTLCTSTRAPCTLARHPSTRAPVHEHPSTRAPLAQHPCTRAPRAPLHPLLDLGRERVRARRPDVTPFAFQYSARSTTICAGVAPRLSTTAPNRRLTAVGNVAASTAHVHPALRRQRDTSAPPSCRPRRAASPAPSRRTPRCWPRGCRSASARGPPVSPFGQRPLHAGRRLAGRVVRLPAQFGLGHHITRSTTIGTCWPR